MKGNCVRNFSILSSIVSTVYRYKLEWIRLNVIISQNILFLSIKQIFVCNRGRYLVNFSLLKSSSECVYDSICKTARVPKSALTRSYSAHDIVYGGKKNENKTPNNCSMLSIIVRLVLCRPQRGARLPLGCSQLSETKLLVHLSHLACHITRSDLWIYSELYRITSLAHGFEVWRWDRP